MLFDWQVAFRDALRAGLVEEAQRAAHVALVADEWSRIRAVAGRPLDHDVCFVVAECALRKVASLARSHAEKTEAPLVVDKPWGLLRRFLSLCLSNAASRPRREVFSDAPPEASVGADPELRAALALCFDQLSDIERETVRLLVAELPDAEMAMLLRLSQAGVRTRRRRARQSLRECLEKRGVIVDGGDDE